MIEIIYDIQIIIEYILNILPWIISIKSSLFHQYIEPYLYQTVDVVTKPLIFYPMFLIIAIGLAYLFYITLIYMSKWTTFLGNYSSQTSKTKIFKYYLFLTFPVYITVLSFLNPTSEEFYLAFLTACPIIIGYLLSLRFLANPTCKTIQINRQGCKIWEFWKYIKIVREIEPFFLLYPDRVKLKLFKERVISFYFSLTEAAIFVYFMNYIFKAINATSPMELIKELIPPIRIDLLVTLLASYLLALFVAAIFGEYFLKKLEPIPDLSDC